MKTCCLYHPISAYLVRTVCACSFRRRWFRWTYATRALDHRFISQSSLFDFLFALIFFYSHLSSSLLFSFSFALRSFWIASLPTSPSREKSKQTFACLKFLYLININDFDLMKLIFSWVCLPFVFVSFSEYHVKCKLKRPIIYFKCPWWQSTLSNDIIKNQPRKKEARLIMDKPIPNFGAMISSSTGSFNECRYDWNWYI